MDNLFKHITGKDLFENDSIVDDSIIQEFYVRNERKKEDDKWLKDHKLKVLKSMQQLGKNKADFGDVRVSYTTPDQSHFDEGKVLEFAKQHGLYEDITKTVLDEVSLVNLIEQGLIDLDQLKEFAWVEKFGTERIIVKKVPSNEEA